MKKTLFVVALILCSTGLVFSQNNGPGGRQGPPQPSLDPMYLKNNGFNDQEIKQITTDGKALEKKMQDLDADLKVQDAEKNKQLLKDTIDLTALEKVVRQIYDDQFQKDWAKFQLIAAWKTQYGNDKGQILAKALQGPPRDGMMQGPQGQR